MAVRNLQAIQRQGRAIAEAKKNEHDLRAEHFWSRVNKITDTRKDAIDCIDTIKALCENGLRKRFEEWMDGKNVHYNHDSHFCVFCSCPRNETESIKYYPKENYVCFAWQGYGMFSCYQTNVQSDVDRLIDHELVKDEGFDDGLTKFSTCLKPFFDEFFSWIETL